MSWFRRGSSRSDSGGGGTAVAKHPSPRSPDRALESRSRVDTDPDTCLEVFRIHWKQALNIIDPDNLSTDLSSSSGSADRKAIQSDDIETVIHNVEQMVNLLISEQSSNGMPGSILHYLLEHEILKKFFTWCSSVTDYSERLKTEQLKMYELLISQSKQLLLIHKPVIHPLLQLLGSCAELLDQYRSKDLERRMVLVLHQLCVCLSQQTLILESFFSTDTDHGPAKFLIFSLLIPYVHREGNVGQQARDALLLIMALSAKNDNIGRYVAQNSHFCPVLATGLSGLYSSLPRKLNIPSDDWHQLSSEDCSQMPDLQMFLNSLEFCNAVAQVAHMSVREQLINYIYDGFLVPVLGPALHQDVSGVPLSLLESRLFVNSRDEIIAATAYLELFIRRITEPALLRAFLKFVLVGKFDEISILDSLITRISTNSRLCVGSLSLFKTLVELNCEDVMFQLVFRFLIPCTHVMVSQRRAVKELDLYSKSAEKFLSLQPACCVLHPDASSSTTMAGSPGLGKPSYSAVNQSMDGVFDSPALAVVSHSFQSPDSAHDSPVDSAHSPNKSGLGFSRLFRSSGSLNKSLSSGRQRVMDSRSSLSNSILSMDEQSETNYMDYLHEAQQRILACARACKHWSAPYDGETPPSDSVLEDKNTNKTTPPSLEDNSKITNATKSSKDDNVFENSTEKSASTAATKLSTDTVNGSLGVKLSSHGTSVTSLSRLSPERKMSGPSQLSLLSQTSPTDGATRDAYSVSPTKYPSSPTSSIDISKCLDLDSFIKYLNTVEVASPSTPADDVDKCFQELDILVKEITSQPTTPDSTTSLAAYVRDRADGGTEPFQDKRSPLEAPTITETSSSGLNDSTTAVEKGSSESSGGGLSANADNDTTCSFVNISLSAIESSVSGGGRDKDTNTDTDNVAASPDMVQKEMDRTLSSTEQSSTASTSTAGTDRLSTTSMDSRPRHSSSESTSSFSLSASSKLLTPPRLTSAYLSASGTPNIGSFLSALLSKLEGMMQNSLYVNLLLTGLISRLACYPQPLLRSFLLNHNLVFQPSVKSLMQVLSSTRQKVDNFARTLPNFDTLLLQARKFLSLREQMYLADFGVSHPMNASSTDRQSPHMSIRPTRSSSVTEFSRGEKRRTSISDLLFKKSPAKDLKERGQSSSPTTGSGSQVLERIAGGSGYRYVNKQQGISPLQENTIETMKTKNAVYCALILEEFVKELASLAQEHAVLSLDEGYASS